MTTPTLEQMFPGKTLDEIQALVNNMRPRLIEFPDLNPRNLPQSTLANFEELLRYYNISIRHNEMTKQTEIDIPGETFHGDTEQNAKIAELYSRANKQNMPDKMIMSFITKVANKNAYHPVRDWIDEQTWDGQDHLQAWYDSVELEIDNPMKEIMMYKWALSAVAALYHPNFSCEGVLTYQSTQGKGKTISIQSIIPRDKHTQWTKDGVVIDTKNKDSQMKALGYWITEMGEIDATFRKSDMEALKGFITEKMDEIRPPYERSSNRYSRRTVFYGSVNEREFLQDSENRRFWVLGVRKFKPVKIDVAQFWAQLKHSYQQICHKVLTAADREHYQEWGWFMSPSERERMKSLQAVFKSIEPIEQILEANVMPYTGAGYSGQRMNTTTILMECGHSRVSKRDSNIAAKWLRDNNFVADGLRRFEVNIARSDHAYKFEEGASTIRKLPKNTRDWG